MLYKPTAATPCREKVNPDDLNKSGISFGCTLLSSSKVAKTRLMIGDGGYEYYFDSPPLTPTIINRDYGVDIEYSYRGENASYAIQQSNNRRMSSEDIENPLKKLYIQSGRSYTWQMRIYEDRAVSWIGYGTIEAVKEVSSQYILKIRPHTNIYFPEALPYGIYPQFWSRYDNNAEYFIKTNNGISRIEAYTCYDPSSEEGYFKDKDMSYDTPLYGYAKVDANFTITQGEPYTIYCNYIDTDLYYFEASTPPQITLSECFNVNGSELLRDIEKDTLVLEYSNLHIKGRYYQNDGATVNYYNFLLEELVSVDENEEHPVYRVVDATNNIYSPTVEYMYDNIIGGSDYRLTLHVTDTDNVTTGKILYISAVYLASIYPMQFKPELYMPHNSVIMDFRGLVSIPAHEELSGQHQYVALNPRNGEPATDTWYPQNACHVDLGNCLTYNQLDGEGDLSIKNGLFYFILSVDDVYNGTVFEAEDDDGNHITGSFDGVCFTLAYTNNGNVTHQKLYFSPYASWLAENSTRDLRTSAVTIAMREGGTDPLSQRRIINIDVPFLYYDELEYRESNYYHPETAMSEYGWAIIVDLTANTASFKNIAKRNGIWEEAGLTKWQY